jgi:ferric-dicitrate binding protein FerR (iron transport regulator)
MDCQEAATLISGHIDHELESAKHDALDTHVQECVSCRAAVERFRYQDQALRRLYAGCETAGSSVAERVIDQLHAMPKPETEDGAAKGQRRLGRRGQRRAWALAVAATIGGLLLLSHLMLHRPESLVPPDPGQDEARRAFADLGKSALTPRSRPPAEKPQTLAVGKTIETRAGDRWRLGLPDGSIVYVNGGTHARLDADRHLVLTAGEVFLEVSPRAKGKAATFVVKTPDREIQALGTKFAVQVTGKQTGVLVTQGKVQVGGLDSPIVAGQQLAAGATSAAPAPRVSHLLDWTQELMTRAESPLIPASQYAGGAMIAVDPNGQEAKLSLRKFHIDVHIEDGFARTTIDQTYFNHDPWRMEGTFYFPLPPDASLSRLAMYVDGRLMEGGMADRDHARQVYETIRYTQRDPALLEWVDGSTFKMRVFPLEGRQEKRIILSYTQKLDPLYGRTKYRFPAGHSMQSVGDWSVLIRVKNGAGLAWGSDSHTFQESKGGGDLVLRAEARNIKPDKDVALNLSEVNAEQKGQDVARFSSAVHEGSRYLMLRYRPLLSTQYSVPSTQYSPGRDWVFLFESSGDRDPLLGRVQIDVLRTLLANAEYQDTFTLLTAGTRVRPFSEQPMPVTEENVKKAMDYLEHVRLIGALDLGRALQEAVPFIGAAANPCLVHVGSGIAAMGERREDVLARRIPDGVRYLGVGVGKRWSRSFMKMAAERSGGYFTQINPDEPVAWRTFELLATLRTPRLLNVKVVDNAERASFLTYAGSLAQGEELCAIARLGSDEPMPETVTITGALDGKPFQQVIPVRDVAERADYLARTWAKLEIERLLAEDASKNKEKIVALSKAMYVMTPFTSLLVLENETMYEQYKVDRGRKDHWAMYPCPGKIPVVTEPASNHPNPVSNGPKTFDQVLQTILVRVPPRFLFSPGQLYPFDGNQVVSAEQLYQGDPTISRITPEVLRSLRALGPLPPAEIRALLTPMGESTRSSDKSRIDRDKRVASEIARMPALERNGLWLSALEMLEAQGMTRGRADKIDDSLLTSVVPSRSLIVTDAQIASLNDHTPPPNIPLTLSPDGKSTAFSGRNTGVWSIGVRADVPLGYRDPHVDHYRLSPYLNLLTPDAPRANFYSLVEPLPARVGQVLIVGNELTKQKVAGTLRAKPLPTGGVAGIPFRTTSRQSGIVVNGVDWPGNTKSDNGSLQIARYLESVVYQRPSVTGDDRIFTDLIAQARGMNTSQADILAILTTEALPVWPTAIGYIDPTARKLIDQARSARWRSIVFTAAEGDNRPTIVFDGRGQYAFSPTEATGLREQVICDGQTLLHLYPDLGVGAKRTVSRFHRAEFASLVPWVLPPAEDFAHDADVKCMDERTVAIIPHGLDDAKDADVKPVVYQRIHLIFGPDGQLAERRLVEMPSGKTVLRETYDAGVVKLLDPDGKTIASREGRLSAAQPPDLKPDTANFVVLPMPLRTPEHIMQSPKVHDKNLEDLATESALELFAAKWAAGKGDEAVELFGRRFHVRNFRPLGFYVLLAACGVNVDQEKQYLNVLAAHPHDLLAEYLAFYTNPELRRHAHRGEIAGPRDGFLQRLAAFRVLYSYWHGGKAKSASEATRQSERERAFAYIRQNQHSLLGWALLSVLQDQAGDDAAFYGEIVESWSLFKNAGGLGYVSRYEQARCLLKAGRRVEARTGFRDLYTEMRKEVILPAIDASFREALQSDGKDEELWGPLMRETAGALVMEKRRPEVIALARQCWQLGDQLLADNVLATALEGLADGTERLTVTLAAIDFLMEIEQPGRADRLLQSLLADARLAQAPSLWRLGQRIAGACKQTTRAFECLEKALDLEYRRLPEVVNLEEVRKDYGALLEHYQRMLDAMQTLEVPPPRDFAAKVVGAADRWRALDRDGTAACQAAAKILQSLGASDGAWEYLTTPIGLQPNEAAPWLSLAQTQQKARDFDLADRAYAAAFEAEPTNAQILWDRARNLQHAGKPAEAETLYRQLAEGEWQPRFRGLQAQARWQIGKR